MTVGVTHPTPADGTFSAGGTAAWNEEHTVTGIDASVTTFLANPAAAELNVSTISAGNIVPLSNGASTNTFPYFTSDTTANTTVIHTVGRTLLAQSTVQLQKETLDNQHCFLLPSNSFNHNPADATTRYLGAFAPFAQEPVNRIYVRNACVIKECTYYTVNTGTLGSAETASTFIRVNDTTDNLLHSTVTYSSLVTGEYSRLDLNIPLAAGQWFVLKVVYPTFGTNPVSTYHVVQVLAE